MRETSIRNADGSYKPEAMVVGKKTLNFVKQLLEEHPDMHPDDIHIIINNCVHTECSLTLALKTCK